MNIIPPTSTPGAAATANISIAKADSRKLAQKEEVSKVEPERETNSSKFELVALWVLFAVWVILTVLAGYILWKKVALTS